MTSLAKIPANLDLAATIGSDLIFAVTVNENTHPYSFDGATIETVIIGLDDKPSATNFTVTTLNNVATLALTTVDTTTLGNDSYRYELRVTKDQETSPWLGGTLTITPRGVAGASATMATLNLNPEPSVTLDLSVGFGVIPDAEAVPFEPSDPLTETNVQDAIMELATKLQARIPTVKSSVYIDDNATPTPLTQGVGAKVEGTFLPGPTCMACSYNGNRITYNGTRNTRALAVASIDLIGGNNQTYFLELRKNDQPVAGVRTKIRHGNVVASGSLNGFINLTQGDYIELWVTNLTASSAATITDATFALAN